MGSRELNKGSAPHPCSYAQHCHHLRYLGCDPRIVLCSTGLSKFFFSIPLASEPQDPFPFPWEGQQWTFRVLLQGYQHMSTMCHGMVT